MWTNHGRGVLFERLRQLGPVEFVITTLPGWESVTLPTYDAGGVVRANVEKGAHVVAFYVTIGGEVVWQDGRFNRVFANGEYLEWRPV